MTSIYCKTIAKGKQAYYLRVNNNDYMLFIQNYKKSNRDYFADGQPLSVVFGSKNVHSTATLKTIERLRPAIRYIEKEYGICVLDSTKKMHDKTKAPYKRQRFMPAREDYLTA